MPLVYGIEVADGNLARNAQWLMHAQVAICGIGVIGGIAGLVRYYTAKSTIESWVELSGEGDLETNGSMEDASQILTSAIVVLVPLLLILLVRNAIRNNSRDIFNGICIFEGICSVCSTFAVLNAVVTIPTYMYLKQRVDRYDCSTAQDVERCESARYPTESYLTIVITFLFIQLVLSICEVTACVTGTAQASKASNALQRGLVFTGPPKAPQVTTMAIGQPASSPDGPTKGNDDGFPEPTKVVDGVQPFTASTEQNQVVVGVPV